MPTLNLKVPQHSGSESPSQVLADLKSDMQALETSNNDIEARQQIVDNDAQQVAADRAAVAADKAACDQAVIDAQQSATDAANSAVAAAQSEANAAAVVTGGTATFTPAPGKIPLADANGKIHGGWLGDLPAIAQTIVANAVDFFVYDTSKDSDGGAWRKRCQHLSWYNETLNTATRGATREFPAKALIVAEAAKVTIYDLTDPAVPMWMVFRYFNGAWHQENNTNQNSWAMLANGIGGGNSGQEGPKAVAAVNGTIVVGNYAVYNGVDYGGIVLFDFIKDKAEVYTKATSNHRISTVGIASRHTNMSTQYRVGSAVSIINSAVNDVAITVLPDAPIDPATGLPVPTIAVATAGGVSVIKSDGTVANSVSPWTTNAIYAEGSIAWCGAFPGSLNAIARFSLDIPGTSFDWALYGGTPTQPHGYLNPVQGRLVADRRIVSAVRMDTAGINAGIMRMVANHQDVNPRVSSTDIFAFISSMYNTGWMVGDIRRCFLANSLTADRSVKGGTLTMVGTVTETVNAGGRNVYSGFSSANYLQEASHADWNNLGTGDFSIIMSGVKWPVAGGAAKVLFDLGYNSGLQEGIYLYRSNTTNKLGIGIGGGILFETSQTFTDADEHVVELKRGTFGGVATIQLLVDGIVVGSAVSSASISTTSNLVIGNNNSGLYPWTGGQVACVRISATAPTDEQSKFIAETENKLNGGAACLLSADAVTRLTYDEDSDILGVETANAYDYLKGLEIIQRGVARTDTADLGFQRVQVNGTTDVRVSVPARALSDALMDKSRKLAEAQQTPQTFGFSGDAATVTFWLPQGWKPQSAYVGGARKFEGSTADYTVVFDGFRYGVTFAVAPAAGTNNVVIEGVRV